MAARSHSCRTDPATGLKRRLSTVDGFVAGIDVRTGKTPNHVHPQSHGHAAVAIVSGKGFDALASVDQRTLRFRRTGTEASLRKCKARGVDVNREQDLVPGHVPRGIAGETTTAKRVDGILLAPWQPGTMPDNWLGRSQYAADPRFNGRMQDLRIYSGALSASEIASRRDAQKAFIAAVNCPEAFTAPRV